MDSSEPPAVSRSACLLGYAGLIPQAAAVGALAAVRFAEPDAPGMDALLGPALALAVIYPLVILSFLGGIWWGFAMQRTRSQGTLAAAAVVPSLIALALLAAVAVSAQIGWGLVAIGAAVLLTLLVDRRLVSRGDTPADWMRLRVPLSVGLGSLTIIAGILIGGQPPATF